MLWGICNISTLMTLVGSWNFAVHRSSFDSDPWRACPKAHKHVSALFPGQMNYSHAEKQFQAARYHPQCTLLPLQQALTLRKPQDYSTTGDSAMQRVVFVGDSLVGQVYAAAECMLDHHGLSTVTTTFFNEVFLRDDIPCESQCVTNSTYLKQYYGSILSPCWACSLGYRKTWAQFLENPQSWVNRIPNDTVAIVIGSGAWYNYYKGLVDSKGMFSDTLSRLAPILEQFVARGIQVYWLGLPPVVREHWLHVLKQEYGWDEYSDKDYLAHATLNGVGVRFVNVSHLTLQRKQQDRYISGDPIHWCSPGPHSVPAFLVHVLFHLITFG